MIDPKFYALDNRSPYDEKAGATVPGHSHQMKALMLLRMSADKAMVRRFVSGGECEVAPVVNTATSRTAQWLFFPDGPLEKFISVHDSAGVTLWSKAMEHPGRGFYDIPSRSAGPGTTRGLLEHLDDRLLEVSIGHKGAYLMVSQSEIMPALSQNDIAAMGLDPGQVHTLNGRSLVIRAMGAFGLPGPGGSSPAYKGDLNWPVDKPTPGAIPIAPWMYYLLPPLGWWPNGFSVDTSGPDPEIEELPNPCGELRGWESLVYHGTRDKRYRITILGDGFTEAEQTKFIDWSDTLVRALHCTEPFRRMWRCLDIDRVFAVSRSSGVTGCPCGCDERCTYYGCQGSWPTDTGGESYPAYIGTPFPERIRHAASLPPGGKEGCGHLIVVLVNCPVAGGSAPPNLGISFATLGDSPDLDIQVAAQSFVDIAIHEMAHVAAPLAEEYIGCAPEVIPDLGTFHLVDEHGNPVNDPMGNQIILNLDVYERDRWMNQHWLRYENMGFFSDESFALPLNKWDQASIPWYKAASLSGHILVAEKRFRTTWAWQIKHAPMYSDFGDIEMWPAVHGEEPHWPTDPDVDLDREMGLFFGCQAAAATGETHECDPYNDRNARNFYRAMTWCKMRSETYPFCEVCQTAIRTRIRRACVED